jgi:hypothetical protein
MRLEIYVEDNISIVARPIAGPSMKTIERNENISGDLL